MSVRTPWFTRIARVVTVLAVAGVAALPGAPASAAVDGYVRLAHLSPDTPAVDVYLSSQSGAVAEKTFPGVAYGALSDYLRLPAGGYAVAMRTAGAARSQAPVLTTQLTVAPGGAYTVAGVGRYADLGLRVLTDDLGLPAAGTAKVRIVQASVRAPVLTVTATDGPTLGSDVAFASTTEYRQVPPGGWTLRVRPTQGAPETTVAVTLGAGSVYSLLILDAPGGGLRAELHTDAGRRGVVPAGGVETGAGGTQPSSTTGSPTAAMVASLVVLLAAVLGIGLRRRLRRR